jgi:hypothetical protein
MCSFRSWRRIYCGRLLPIFRRNTSSSQKFAGSISNGLIGDFSLTQSSRWHYGTGIKSASNRNESQQYFQCVRLTSLPLSYAGFHVICDIRPSGTLRAFPGLHRDFFTFSCCLYPRIFMFCSACEMWMWRREKHIRRRLETFFTAMTRKRNTFGDVLSCIVIENDQRFWEISYTSAWSNWGYQIRDLIF